jgi:hypothetical protein
MFFNGLMSLDSNKDYPNEVEEGEMSVSLKCSEALYFLSLIIGDQMLEMSLHYVQSLVEHAKQSNTTDWTINFTALLALNSTIEGISPMRIFESFKTVMSWLYEKA